MAFNLGGRVAALPFFKKEQDIAWIHSTTNQDINQHNLSYYSLYFILEQNRNEMDPPEKCSLDLCSKNSIYGHHSCVLTLDHSKKEHTIMIIY